MSMFETERVDARRILLNRLLELDQISDKEIEEHGSNDHTPVFTLLRLSKLSRAERAFVEQE